MAPLNNPFAHRKRCKLDFRCAMTILKLICKTMILFPVLMMEQPSTSQASSSATSQLKCDKAQCGKVFRKYSLKRHTRLIPGNENTASCHICAIKSPNPISKGMWTLYTEDINSLNAYVTRNQENKSHCITFRFHESWSF